MPFTTIKFNSNRPTSNDIVFHCPSCQWLMPLRLKSIFKQVLSAVNVRTNSYGHKTTNTYTRQAQSSSWDNEVLIGQKRHISTTMCLTRITTEIHTLRNFGSQIRELEVISHSLVRFWGLSRFLRAF